MTPWTPSTSPRDCARPSPSCPDHRPNWWPADVYSRTVWAPQRVLQRRRPGPQWLMPCGRGPGSRQTSAGDRSVHRRPRERAWTEGRAHRPPYLPETQTNTQPKQQLSRRLDGYLADRRSSSAGSSTSREAVRVAERPRAVHEPPSREESARFAWANSCHAESKSQRQHRVGKCGGRYSRNSCFVTFVTSEERPMRFAT